ncbi:STAS domain-containing protein [Heyndrickxia acidiproducens]|uniref:STAS domain-containing protein n=1 Tax=Heyndrickxia acidiproducens TaxID=1121084 RepID=UPI000376A7DA|nr:STAS domain-containing protein [Heyndrickxia acidiproducens]
MRSITDEKEEIKAFLLEHRDEFEEKLLNEAVNVRDKIDEILKIGNIDLLNNAHKLVLYVVEQREKELIDFANQEGIAWATHSLTLAFKLEWVQAIRRTLWVYLKDYGKQTQTEVDQDYFFDMEKRVNDKIDQFLNQFFICYSTYKDKLIDTQKRLVENLSVPIIPITPSVSILPLIGSIDSFRSNIIEEKVLLGVGRMHIQTLIMDFSGIAEMDMDVIEHIFKIIDGNAMMGCRVVITGLRPQIVRELVLKGLSFENKAETKGTLQQALRDYIKMDENKQDPHLC